MKLSFCFIVNPIAGKGKAAKLIPLIQQQMEEKKLSYTIKQTCANGEGKILAVEALEEGYDIIVAVGGDGTINEVISGVYKLNGVVGIIPAGTGNDFARSLDISTNFYNAINNIFNGTINEIDTGLINNQIFINVASIGLDAHIAAEANKLKRYFTGTKAYIISLLKGLITYKSIKVKVVMEKETIDKRIMLAAFCNGAYYGGGMNIAPTADPTDNLLDICIVEDMSKLKLLKLFPTIFKGKHTVFKEVKVYRAKELLIYSDNDLVINTDGEISCYSPNNEEAITVKIAAQRLKIIK